MYGDELIELSDENKTVSEFTFKEDIFTRAIRKVYKERGYSEEVLSSKEGIALIEETYNILSSQVSISERTPRKVKDLIDQNLWRFSGFKSDIQMREAANKLYNENGELKSFKDFAKDVKQIHHNYNMNYLRSEYDHVARSVEMFNLWNDLEEDDELQYRTMQDNKVREDHRALDGTTLPKSDPFWELYYPPNGWNCRCTAKPVRKGKYKRSSSKSAIAKGNAATNLPKQQIFRTNPGITLNLMPDKHPYFPKNCGDCDGNKADLRYDPNNPKCRSCRIINALWKTPENVKQIRKDTLNKAKEQLKGKSFKHKEIPGEIQITKKGIEEMVNQPHKFYFAKMKAMSDIVDIVQNGKIVKKAADEKNNPMVNQYLYLEIEIADGIKSYAIIREMKNGDYILYDIVQKIKEKNKP